MENKDYIEIFDENGSTKFEIVLSFENPEYLEYTYIVYKEFENNNQVFAGRIKKQEDAILETNLSNEEKEFIQKVFDETMKI